MASTEVIVLASMHSNIHTHAYIRTHTCAHTNTHTHTHKHTHTHTHAHTTYHIPHAQPPFGELANLNSISQRDWVAAGHLCVCMWNVHVKVKGWRVKAPAGSQFNPATLALTHTTTHTNIYLRGISERSRWSNCLEHHLKDSPWKSLMTSMENILIRRNVITLGTVHRRQCTRLNPQWAQSTCSEPTASWHHGCLLLNDMYATTITPTPFR